MQRIKLLGLAFLAILAINALGAAATQAATPELLPEATAANPITFTSISIGLDLPKLVLLSGKEIECLKATNKGKQESLKLGTIIIVFEDCKGLGVQCTGLGDTTAGNITVEGTYHIFAGLLIKTKEEVVAIPVLLTKSVHFTCGGLVLVEVLLENAATKEKGCIAGHVEPVGKLTKALIVSFKQEKGDPDIREIAENLKEAKKVKCSLFASVSGGAAESSAELAEAELTKFEQKNKEGKLVAIEVLIDA